ncbi:MAG: hypothetical protein Q4D94_14375 [Bacillota bacterium]|nr:hypothetical protein [Bacillota bacterium]
MKKKNNRKNNSTKKINNFCIELDNLSISDNETLSMVERYKFDSKSAKEMSANAQKVIDELNMLQEQKEYEEMNYYAIYRRMSRYKLLEIIILLVKCLINLKEQES